MSLKFVHNFLSYFARSQTNKQTPTCSLTSPVSVKKTQNKTKKKTNPSQMQLFFIPKIRKKIKKSIYESLTVQSSQFTITFV